MTLLQLLGYLLIILAGFILCKVAYEVLTANKEKIPKEPPQ